MTALLTALAAAAIVVPALAAVLLPWLRRQADGPAPGAARRPSRGDAALAAELTRARDAKRAALEDLLALEADYRAGVLGEADYRELRRQDEARALALIARVDELGRAAGMAEPAALGAAGGTAAEAEPARPGGRPRTAGAAAPRWLRPPVQAGLAGLLLVAGLGAGYLVAVQAAPDRVPRVTGEAGAAMPGPVGERVREYRARLETNPRDVEALLGMADLNLQRRDIPRAVEYYKRVIEVDAGNADALARLGMILGEAGQYPESVATLDRALDRDPNHLEALWWKGQVQLFGLEDYRAAATTWERLAALLPPGPDQDRARLALARAREGATRASPASGAAPKARGPAGTTPAPR